MRRMMPYLCLALLLAACEQAREQARQQPERFVPARPVTRIMADTVKDAAKGAWEVAQTPLQDLNLKRQPIPAKLQDVVKNPYALPHPFSCSAIRDEIAQLDELLGEDICTPANPSGPPQAPEPAANAICNDDNPTGGEISHKGEYIEKGAGFARDEAVGIVRGKADIIPFRSIVRRVTGAEKHSKALVQSYEAGKMRRAFLKGVAAPYGPSCLAAPQQSNTLK